MSPVSSGRFGAPAHVQLRAGEAADRTSEVATPGSPASGSLSSTTSRSRSWWARATLPLDVDGAARLAFELQRLDGRRLLRLAAPLPVRLDGLERDLDRPEHVVVAEQLHRGARRDRHVRGQRVERTGGVGVQRQPPADVRAAGERARSMSRRSTFMSTTGDCSGLLARFSHSFTRARALDAAAHHRPGQLVEAQRPRSSAEFATSSGSLRPPALIPATLGVARQRADPRSCPRPWR